MMSTTLLLLLCLAGHVFTKEPPDVDCIIIHLKTVNCSWNKGGTPVVNYAFYSRFYGEKIRECRDYLSENSMRVGCNQPYGQISLRFQEFFTNLVDNNNNKSFPQQKHDLKNKVKLNPPTNLTVQNGSDCNLGFYWKQNYSNCVRSEVRYRINNKNWKTEGVNDGKQSFCINLPSSRSLYELQVRSKIGSSCGESLYWSDWSRSVFWGSNNSTAHINELDGLMSLWTPVLYVVGAITLILLVIMLLHRERLRIIFIPVVPKPSLIPQDIEAWLQISKCLKEGFKASYDERACPVREYRDSCSDSGSCDSSTFSFTTDQTDCSVSLPGNKSDHLSQSCSSSTSAAMSSDEQQVFA